MLLFLSEGPFRIKRTFKSELLFLSEGPFRIKRMVKSEAIVFIRRTIQD